MSETVGHNKKSRFYKHYIFNVLKAEVPCAYCNSLLTFNTATVDHIVSRRRGGSKDYDNMTFACQPCNNAKDDKIISPVYCLERKNRFIGGGEG
jgi:5-methylcytosine-specific restriction endonuclease McrA